MLACRRDIVSQKDAEITRLTDVVRHQDAVQDEMTAKVCKLENELLSVRTEELKATPMASEDALDYTLLDSETTLHSDDAHDEATLDKNEEESSSVPFNKTLSCGKLETIPEGSDVNDLECVHQPPPPQPRGRMPPASVMRIRARLNSSRKATQTEEIARLECQVRKEEVKEQTTKVCKVDAQKATSLIQADDLKAYNVVDLETNESKAYQLVELETNESKSDVEHHEETKMCAVKKSRNKKEQAQFTHSQRLGENDLQTPNERDHTDHRPSSHVRLSSKKDMPNNKTQDTVTSGPGIRVCVSPREMKARNEQCPKLWKISDKTSWSASEKRDWRTCDFSDRNNSDKEESNARLVATTSLM
ncbi:hypothetical protein AeMF1_007086 [Aphanomyces euteiches]|nr:hypothetical protein AeMF1_007103 [Aphanomyces euteiches]KAH9120984.1 hypothetical protein AeMF1_007086 [Aphanomyces euteiches]